jgi:hypothetical protein
MDIVLISCGLLIIAGLSFYAGSLLFKLKKQNQVRAEKTQQRIDNITQSIQTIAKAVDQQQCNLSEASIRLYHLLEALPLKDKPDYSASYPNVYTLYDAVKDLPTHQARKDQPKLQTRKQDMHREDLEAKLESNILKEMAELSRFSV